MKTQVMTILLSAMLATACGSSAQKSQEVSANVPAAAIVRVPVGTDGKEDLTKAELRGQNESVDANDKAQLANAFDKAAPAVVKSAEELDKGTSTQAWCGRGYGYGYGYGYSYYPSYYYGNSYYNYGYGYSYYGRGYNYYYYPRYY